MTRSSKLSAEESAPPRGPDSGRASPASQPASPPAPGTAAVIPGPSSMEHGRPLRGVARCEHVALAGGAHPPISVLVVSAPVDPDAGISEGLGARFAADEASACFVRAVEAWLLAGADVDAILPHLHSACEELVQGWSRKIQLEHLIRRAGVEVAVEEADVLKAHDAAVGVAAFVGHHLYYLGVGPAAVVFASREGEVHHHSAGVQLPYPRSLFDAYRRLQTGNLEPWASRWSRQPADDGYLALSVTATDQRPRTISVALPGAGHTRERGKPCQDAALAENYDGLVLLAVADGHGDPRYVHADLGSRFAVDAVREIVQQDVDPIKREMLAAGEGGGPEQVGRRLAASIVQRWYGRVRSYLTTIGDGVRGSVSDGYSDEMKPFGTTFLAALAWGGVCICMRVGDGDVLFVDENGKATRVFPLPPKEFGNATESLGANRRDAEVPQAMMSVRLERQPRFVLLCSDGVSDPYTPAETEAQQRGEPSALARLWASQPAEKIAKLGWSKWRAELPPLLAQLSRKGTFDDVSVAAAWWCPPGQAFSLEAWASVQLPAIGGDWDGWTQRLAEVLLTSTASAECLSELAFAITAVEGRRPPEAPQAPPPPIDPYFPESGLPIDAVGPAPSAPDAPQPAPTIPGEAQVSEDVPEATEYSDE